MTWEENNLKKYFWYKKLPSEDRAIPTEMMQCLNESDELIIELKKIEDYI